MDELVTIAEATAKVKQSARSIGFADVGIASAEVVDTQFYSEWLSRGYAGTMHYLERNIEKRGDVQLILPGARSVIAVAENYYTPFDHLPSSDSGKISRYAWGEDYHHVVLEKLRRLADNISEILPGSKSKPYVDTGPTMDKLWAHRAGLGWQGKNSNIISRKFGSWFFIGLIITTAELVLDTPISDFCGDCTACLDSCPTGAIVEPYVVNGTLCLSYWTIETKPEIEIPVEIANNMDGWVFGCDVCQDVCPWNRFRKNAEEERYLPRNSETTFLLSDIGAMEQEEFSVRFRNSPVKRTKLAGLKRNAKALTGR